MMLNEERSRADHRVRSPNGTAGCEELGRVDLVDTAECCERCHHGERYAPWLLAGPCHVALPDGRDAFVCCVSKKRLVGGSA